MKWQRSTKKLYMYLFTIIYEKKFFKIILTYTIQIRIFRHCLFFVFFDKPYKFKVLVFYDIQVDYFGFPTLSTLTQHKQDKTLTNYDH